MQKQVIKSAIRQCFGEYYKTGMTNTASRVHKELIKKIDAVYKKRHSK